MRVLTPVRLLVWIGLGLLVEPARVAAVQEQSADDPPSQTEEAPQPIELSEIPRRAENASIRLSEIEASLVGEPDVAAIADELPSWTERLDEARAELARRPLPQMSLRGLTESRDRWVGMEAQIEAWLSRLETRTSELEARLDEVRALERVWSATRQEAAEDIPEGVGEAIARVMTEVARVERAARDRLGSVLNLQNTLAERATSVREEIDRHDAVLDDVRESLLSADAPPLWVALGRGEDRASLMREAFDSWNQTVVSVRRYIGASLDRLAAHFLAFLTLLWLFAELHKRGRRFKDRDGLEASVRVLSHPIANALLIALLLTRLFHPRAPLGIYELNRLLLLIPLLTILPGLVYAVLRAPLYALAVLYVGDLAVDILPTQAHLTRWMELALAGSALLGLVQLAKPGGRVARLELGAWWRAALVAARLGAVLLAVSVIANLLGRVRLSILLTDATLTSAFAGVALFAGTLVLQGLWTLILETRQSRSLQSVRTNADGLRSVGIKLLRLGAVASWVAISLGTLQLLDPFLEGVRGVLGATLSVGELEVSLSDVIALAVTVYLAVQVSRLARVVLEDDVLPRFSLPRGVPAAVSMLAHYVIVLVGMLFALAAAGIELNRFALLAGAFGVGIGFGLQNIVNNFVSGLILLFERPIQVGDTIELESLFGNVRRIGIRSSTVRTFDGAEVIVPNAHLIDSRVVNWTLSDRLRRIEVTVGVAYGSRPRTVIETLLEVAKKHEEILDEPAPYALFEGFGDSSLDFILRAWTSEFEDFLRIRSELRLGIHDALEAAGFVIPFPQRDLHVKSMPDRKEGTSEEAETAPTDQRETTRTK